MLDPISVILTALFLIGAGGAVVACGVCVDVVRAIGPVLFGLVLIGTALAVCVVIGEMTAGRKS